MTTLTVSPVHAALLLAGKLRAVPIDAERCGCDHGRERFYERDCERCSGSGLVAPQPGHWTLVTNDEPCPNPECKDGGVLVDSMSLYGIPGGEDWAACDTCNGRKFAPGQVVGTLTVTAVVPVVRVPHGDDVLRIVRMGDDRALWLCRGHEALTDLSDHLLPGVDWSLPYAALIGDAG